MRPCFHSPSALQPNRTAAPLSQIHHPVHQPLPGHPTIPRPAHLALFLLARGGKEGGQMCRQRVLVQQRSMDLTEILSVRSWKPSTAALHLTTVMGRPRGTLSQPFDRLRNSLKRRMKLRSQPASSLACLKVLRAVNTRPQVHLPCQGVHPHSPVLDGNRMCVPLRFILKWCMLSNAFYLALSNLLLSVICGHVMSERVKQSP